MTRFRWMALRDVNPDDLRGGSRILMQSNEAVSERLLESDGSRNKNALKHGRYTAEAIAQQRQARAVRPHRFACDQIVIACDRVHTSFCATWTILQPQYSTVAGRLTLIKRGDWSSGRGPDRGRLIFAIADLARIPGVETS